MLLLLLIVDTRDLPPTLLLATDPTLHLLQPILLLPDLIQPLTQPTLSLSEPTLLQLTLPLPEPILPPPTLSPPITVLLPTMRTLLLPPRPTLLLPGNFPQNLLPCLLFIWTLEGKFVLKS